MQGRARDIGMRRSATMYSTAPPPYSANPSSVRQSNNWVMKLAAPAPAFRNVWATMLVAMAANSVTQ